MKKYFFLSVDFPEDLLINLPPFKEKMVRYDLMPAIARSQMTFSFSAIVYEPSLNSAK